MLLERKRDWQLGPERPRVAEALAEAQIEGSGQAWRNLLTG
jgi:hypothetical protein